MPQIQRSALVGHPAHRMFDLVNDVAAYPRRFSWCETAEVLEHDDTRMLARLDLGLGSLRTWFATENLLERPHRIDMQLRDGPFSISASTFLPNVRVSIRAAELERYGPALLMDQSDQDGARVLIWTE